MLARSTRILGYSGDTLPPTGRNLGYIFFLLIWIRIQIILEERQTYSDIQFRIRADLCMTVSAEIHTCDGRKSCSIMSENFSCMVIPVENIMFKKKRDYGGF